MQFITTIAMFAAAAAATSIGAIPASKAGGQCDDRACLSEFLVTGVSCATGAYWACGVGAGIAVSGLNGCRGCWEPTNSNDICVRRDPVNCPFDASTMLVCMGYCNKMNPYASEAHCDYLCRVDCGCATNE